jgi:hypothetical protein
MTDTIESSQYGKHLMIGKERNRGGQGRIWQTDDPCVLLKQFEPAFITDDPARQEMVRHKAERIYHALCVVNKGTQVELRSLPREYVSLMGKPCYLMEKAEGELLQTILRGQDTPQEERLALGCALARAMRLLHAGQMIHVDVHPENYIVLRTPTGWIVYILDIDGGGLFSPPGPIYPMSQPKRIYKAPELAARKWQQLHKENLFFAPDDWALAVLLYQLLVDYEGPFCSVRKHPDSAVTNYAPYPPFAYREPGTHWPLPWQEAVMSRAALPDQVISYFYATFQYRFALTEKNKSPRPTAEQWEAALSPPPPPPLCHVSALHTVCTPAKSAQPPRPVPVPASVAGGPDGAHVVQGSCLPLPARQAAPLCSGDSVRAPGKKKRCRLWTAKGLFGWCRSFLGAGSARPWPSVTTLL